MHRVEVKRVIQMPRKQNWKLYLDDIRYPLETDMSWRLARNYDDACWFVQKYGLPNAMSIDHDLGHNYDKNVVGLTGYDFVKWFCNYVQENNLKMPRGFDYYSHSDNPLGKINIITYMSNFTKNVWKDIK